MKEKNIRSGKLKPGYQDRSDPLREEAKKLMKNPGTMPDVTFSASAADKMPMRKYKDGGSVKMNRRMSACEAFAKGGAAKVRKGVADSSGMPMNRGGKK